MHLPEFALPAGRFRRPRREGGAGMYALIRKMAEHIFDTLAESLAQVHQHFAEAAAVGAEEVAIGHNTDDTPIRVAATHMVARRFDRAPQCRRISRRAHPAVTFPEFCSAASVIGMTRGVEKALLRALPAKFRDIRFGES